MNLQPTIAVPVWNCLSALGFSSSVNVWVSVDGQHHGQGLGGGILILLDIARGSISELVDNDSPSDWATVDKTQKRDQAGR